MAYEFEDAYWEEFKNFEFGVEVTVRPSKHYEYVEDDESPVEHILTDEMERNIEEDIYQNKIGE